MQVYVECPFYLTDNGKNRIICEGLLPGSQLQSYFRKRKDYRLQAEIFCCGSYKTCEIYDALSKKYEEGEDD